MLTALKQALGNLSFSRQFNLAITAVLVIGMAAIGTWMGRQIEAGEMNRAAAIAAVYVESVVAAQLRDKPGVGMVDDESHADLDNLLEQWQLRRQVVRLRLWDAEGRITFSSDHAELGRSFPVEGRLAEAFKGQLQARVSDLGEGGNLPEQAHWQRLIEVYVPVRAGNRGKVTAVAVFDLSAENLDRDIRAAQQRSWLLVAVATLAIYLLLFRLVHRADSTIRSQQHDLRLQIQQLRAALDENDRMRERLREAGVKTTALNEEFLFRIAADLHDEPAQAIAFALMRLDEFAVVCGNCTLLPGAERDFRSIRDALQSALRDVRKISSGLTIPGLAELSLADTVRRAIRDFERMSGQSVQAEIDDALDKAPLSVKITVYRLLQESLVNCWRHASGELPRVSVRQADGRVLVSTIDRGAGFDPGEAAVAGRLGLAFMRERVRLLGGVFDVDSAPGCGTCVRASLPLSTEEMIHV